MRFDRYPFSFEVPVSRIVAVLAGIAVLTAIGLVTCGCGPETRPMDATELEAADATVDAWEAVVGPVSPEDRAYVRDLGVVDMTLAEVQEECSLGHFVLGCSYPWAGYYVAAYDVVPGDKWHIASHEVIHVLAWLEFGDSEPDHDDPLIWSRHRAGTVENLAWASYLRGQP